MEHFKLIINALIWFSFKSTDSYSKNYLNISIYELYQNIYFLNKIWYGLLYKSGQQLFQCKTTPNNKGS